MTRDASPATAPPTLRVLLVRYHDSGNVNTRLPESLNRRQGWLPPLGIAHLASALELDGHVVRILDAPAQNLTARDCRAIMAEFRPDLVGITAMTPTFAGALEAAGLARSVGAKVIIGGVHTAIFPAETLASTDVDFVAMGEAEESLRDLCGRLARGWTPGGAVIPGIGYRHEDRLVLGEPVLIQNLDTLPPPAFHLLDMASYNSIIGFTPVTTAITTRGCPYKCSFCFKTPSDKKFRTRSPVLVVDELAYLARRFGIRYVMFYDDVLTLSRPHVTAICEEILRRGLRIRWEAPTRVNVVDRELLGLMARAGCHRLRFGVESGDPGIQSLIEKRITVAQVRDAFGWARQAGIERFAYFMLGYATETPATMQRTIDFSKELDADLVMFTAATPLPRTGLHTMAVAQGLMAENYWSEFTLGKRRDRIPYFVPDADEWVRKAYREFYLRPDYILRRIAKIRSWDSLLKHWDAALGILQFEMGDAPVDAAPALPSLAGHVAPVRRPAPV